jgi:hypothetical protein
MLLLYCVFVSLLNNIIKNKNWWNVLKWVTVIGRLYRETDTVLKKLLIPSRKIYLLFKKADV